MTHVHLVGIGGAGLSAIARFLLERGDVVSGSDRLASPVLHDLKAAGARIYIGHDAEHIHGAEILVRSSAVPDSNVEVQAALEAGIPVLKREQYIGQLMEGCLGIAVAGTHGKTTTTAMIAWMLTVLDQQPSYIVGGVSANLKTNAHYGGGQAFVIEADEYDRMFLGLHPQIALVTNIEHDHPDCYPTLAELEEAFTQFSQRVVSGGHLLYCSDDKGARNLAQRAAREGLNLHGYGLAHYPRLDGPEYFARELVAEAPNFGFRFEAVHGSEVMGQIQLQVPGKHNVSNALAALAAADLLALPLEKAAQALAEFRGTGRRFEILGEANGVVFVDDYAHHPSEIRATLDAARACFNGRRIWAVWQPHTFSRTRQLLDGFALAFRDADLVLVTPIYAAREASPEDGFSHRMVAQSIEHEQVRALQDHEEAVKLLLEELQPGDVLVVLSAGDANQIGKQVLKSLQNAD